MKAPDFYTLREGGEWLKWPFDARTIGDLPELGSSVLVGGIPMHSLLWGHWALGADHVVAWDVFNGWRYDRRPVDDSG